VEDSERDWVEEITNTMIYLLFRITCENLLDFTGLHGMDFIATQDINQLLVSVGGVFITYRPDIKIELRRNKKSLIILDYEVSY
jgi:hypothetical protein